MNVWVPCVSCGSQTRTPPFTVSVCLFNDDKGVMLHHCSIDSSKATMDSKDHAVHEC